MILTASLNLFTTILKAVQNDCLMKNHSAASVGFYCRLDSLAVHTDYLGILASVDAERNAAEKTCEKEETETPHPSHSSWHLLRETVSISSAVMAHRLMHRQTISHHWELWIDWSLVLIVLDIDGLVVWIVVTRNIWLSVDVLLIVLRWRRRLLVVVEQGLLANTVFGHSLTYINI